MVKYFDCLLIWNIQLLQLLANYGNTFDGKVLSSRENDSEDEEEEDIFVKPLTEPAVAESLDREYYNMPYYDTKPCVHVRFPWEDHRKRMYIQNMMTKCADSLVSETEGLNMNDTIYVEHNSNQRAIADLLVKLWYNKPWYKAWERFLNENCESIYNTDSKLVLISSADITNYSVSDPGVHIIGIGIIQHLYNFLHNFVPIGQNRCKANNKDETMWLTH